MTDHPSTILRTAQCWEDRCSKVVYEVTPRHDGRLGRLSTTISHLGPQFSVALFLDDPHHPHALFD